MARRGNARMYTTQRGYLYFEVNHPVFDCDTDKLEEEIIEVISEATGLDYDNIEIEEGIDENILEEGYENYISFILTITVYGSYYYDPGCYYMSNGDPGYPTEFEFTPEEGWIEDVDKAKLIKRLKQIPKLGEALNEDSIYVKLDDFDDDREVEMDDY